jgi:threonyl-tRNA synthetase
MKEEQRLETMRHSLSHVLAQAVLQLYPKAKLGIGPAIENGFYYDFDLGKDSFKPEDLPKIEKVMKKIIQENQKFEKYERSIKESLEYIKKKKQPYKLEMAQDLKQGGAKKLSFYRMVDKAGKKRFVDLCAGPHVKSTKELGAFKLTKIAGAYWKGDEKNKMMQRIYGVAFKNKEELEKYLKQLEEAENRDHRKIGQEQELFMISESVGQGLVLWMPKGATLRRIIENFVLDEYVKNGYQVLYTPHIGNERLFATSGHLSFYKEGMYSPMDIDGEDYYVKPMNCPFHVMIYKNSLKSYRDLPIRYTELGTVYRYERSGTLHGLLRVRGFTQDDGHIICRPDQLEDEIIKALKLTKYVLETFGFREFKVALSVRDPRNKKKYLGKDASWTHAEQALEKGVKAVGWKAEREEGEAVFYGPKVDVKVKDVIGREWQVSTLQVDFNLPSRFKMTYVDKDSGKKEPFMLHRALLGSLERFVGVLIENYAGAFPVWLAPVQVQIIPVGQDYLKSAQKLADELKQEGIRVWVDDLNETVSYRVRKGEKQKIPYILVVGEKEVKGQNLNVRIRGQKEVAKMTRKNEGDGRDKQEEVVSY